MFRVFESLLLIIGISVIFAFLRLITLRSPSVIVDHQNLPREPPVRSKLRWRRRKPRLSSAPFQNNPCSAMYFFNWKVQLILSKKFTPSLEWFLKLRLRQQASQHQQKYWHASYFNIAAICVTRPWLRQMKREPLPGPSRESLHQLITRTTHCSYSRTFQGL